MPPPPAIVEFDPGEIALVLPPANDDHELTLVEFGFDVAGLPGSSGGGGPDIVEINATQNLPALSFVTAGGQVANSTIFGHFNHVVGITMAAVNSGFIAQVVVEGEVTDSNWNWPSNVKLFLNGTTLSTTPASAGFSQLVGITRNSSTVFIRLDVPILL
jgi:hypothetical protein